VHRIALARLVTNQVKVLLIDDHEMFREGIRLLLDKLDFDCDLREGEWCAPGFALMDSCDDLDLCCSISRCQTCPAWTRYNLCASAFRGFP
jgi:hypothetical protein